MSGAGHHRVPVGEPAESGASVLVTDGGEVIPADTWPVGTVLLAADRRLWVKYGGPGVRGERPPEFPWAQVYLSLPTREALLRRSGGYDYARLVQPVTLLAPAQSAPSPAGPS